MAIELTPDEIREVSLAISAYREALDRYRDNGSIQDTIRLLDAARVKLNRAATKARTLTSTA